MTESVRIFLVDDHTVLRQAVRLMLAAESGFSVVGEAGDGDEAVREIQRLTPDVAIVDLKMPGRPGLVAIPRILSVSPKTAVIAFTMYNNPAYVREAMHAGASAYVLKSASKDELLRAVRAVHAGGGFLQAEITKPLLRRLAQDARQGGGRGAPSARELQVLELLGDGKSNKEIAQTLAISDETVKTHLSRLYEKLGVSDRAQAVAIALRQQLIE
jgi:DNA-binding NarL/FixJ family response regulator